MNKISHREQEVLDSLLIEAVRALDLKKAQLCVQKGANILKNDIWVREELSPPGSGSTSSSGNASVVHIVIGRGNWGQSERDFLDGLFALGADIEAKNHSGNTALHIAAANGSSGRVGYLLAKGANPRTFNKQSETPVELASKINTSYPVREEIITLLLGAMPDVKPAVALQTGNDNAKAGAQDATPQERLEPLRAIIRKKGGLKL